MRASCHRSQGDVMVNRRPQREQLRAPRGLRAPHFSQGCGTSAGGGSTRGSKRRNSSTGNRAAARRSREISA